MPVVVRSAEPGDLPRVLRLPAQIPLDGRGEEALPEKGRAGQIWGKILSSPGRSLIVAEDGEQLVGAVDLLAVPNLTHRGAPWAIVENLIVDDKQRKKGIGRALMEAAIRHAREAGCYKVQLLSNRARAEAHGFYKSLGFEPSAEGFRLYFDRR